uniref:Uncharacterized protein n=1 Tax=Romanomermis culicivorax TaxID=13658 RepID=A0A915KHB5_ROMCU
MSGRVMQHNEESVSLSCECYDFFYLFNTMSDKNLKTNLDLTINRFIRPITVGGEQFIAGKKRIARTLERQSFVA